MFSPGDQSENYITVRSVKYPTMFQVDVSNGLGIKTVAVLSSMDAPLGRHVGNALEVKETIQCLQGKGPKSLEDMVTLQGKDKVQMGPKVPSWCAA
jgi:thymidine phosphorylase